MIVPPFWAEGRIQARVGGRQITVRRFGWSDDGPLAAQAHADARTRDAVSAMPWRIGIGEHLRPRPGVWPGLDNRVPWLLLPK